MCFEIKLFKAYFQYVKSKSLRNILELNRSKKKGKLEYSCPLCSFNVFLKKKKKSWGILSLQMLTRRGFYECASWGRTRHLSLKLDTLIFMSSCSCHFILSSLQSLWKVTGHCEMWITHCCRKSSVFCRFPT